MDEDAPTVVPYAIFGLSEPVDIFSAGSYCVLPVLASGGKDMTMNGNNSQQQDNQYIVPMEITREAAHDFGIDPKDLIKFPLGIKKCLVYLVPASKEVYYAYMQPVWAEVKRMVREGRCMIKGKSGKLIRCPESNRCEDCKLFSRVSREQNRPMSLSVLLDKGTEPVAERFEDEVLYSLFSLKN